MISPSQLTMAFIILTFDLISFCTLGMITCAFLSVLYCADTIRHSYLTQLQTHAHSQTRTFESGSWIAQCTGTTYRKLTLWMQVLGIL